MFYEPLFDRVGSQSLREELAVIAASWPEMEVLVLRPPPEALEVMRPNPMDADAAVPTFIHTLAGMRDELARADVWPTLERYLCDGECNGSDEELSA